MKNSATLMTGESPSTRLPHGMPAQNSIVTRMTGNESAVPRSGSFATSAIGTSVMSSAGSQSRMRRRSTLGLSSRRASTSTVPSFAISEGWKRSGPMSSQRLAPIAVDPITSTSASSTSESRNSGHASESYARYGIAAAMHAAASAPAAHTTCRIHSPSCAPGIEVAL